MVASIGSLSAAVSMRLTRSPRNSPNTNTVMARTPPARRKTRTVHGRTATTNTIELGITAPLFTYKHSDANPPGSGPGGFFKGFAIAGGDFYPANGAFPAGYRDQYYFADYVSQFVGRLDPANGNAAYAFATLSGAPVDLLVGAPVERTARSPAGA